MKSIEKMFTVMAIAMLMFSFVLATSYSVSVAKNDKKDTGTTIDSNHKLLATKSHGTLTREK